MSNQFSGTGNIGMAPVVKTVSVNGEQRKVLELRVLFDSYTKDADGELVQDEAASFWKTVSLWGDRANRAALHLVKGSRVHVVGSIRGEKWKDKETGEERYGDSIQAEDVFLSFARVEAVTFRPTKAQAQAQGNEARGE